MVELITCLTSSAVLGLAPLRPPDSAALTPRYRKLSCAGRPTGKREPPGFSERVPQAPKSKTLLWPTRNPLGPAQSSLTFGPAQSSLTTPLIFSSFGIRLTFWISFGIGLTGVTRTVVTAGAVTVRPNQRPLG